jgi:DNA-binding NarL/FixJ family response regulator
VVDDHDLFRTGLSTLLREDGFDVSAAASGEAAVRRLRTFAADVVLMDLKMPGMSGIEATRHVRREAPDAAVVVLTGSGDERDVLDAVRAGAMGYLLKDVRLDDIVAGVRDAAAGHSTIAPRVAGALVAHVREADDEPAEARPGVPNLTPREREILTLLADGLDNGEIGSRLHMSPSTVKHHVSALIRKLGVQNRVQAAVYALRMGIVDLSD